MPTRSRKCFDLTISLSSKKILKSEKLSTIFLKKRLLNKELLVNIFKKDIVLTDWACPIG